MDDGLKGPQANFASKRPTSRSSPKPAATWPPARREPKDRLATGGAASEDIEITFNGRLFLRVALSCIAVLAILGLLVAHITYTREVGVPEIIPRVFLLDEEANLPTFFAFSLLVFCSILLALIGTRAFLARQEFRFHWALLAALFFLIAYDEAAMLHERLNVPTRTALGASGWMYFAWIIPVGILVTVLAVFYLPFLRRLPAPFGWLFLLSGALYVGGALGVEMPGGAYYEAHGKQNFTYQLITTVEETLEMLGLTLFAHSLMRFLARPGGSVRLGFRAG